MKQKNQIDFRKRNLLFVDLETTGLDLDTHEIVEVGCLLVDGKSLEIISEYSAKTKPTHVETATPKAIEISGYSPKTWNNAKKLEDVLRDVSKMGKGALVAGWKVDFDWWFLERAFNEHNIKHDFDYHLIDVISLAYVYFRKKKHVKGLSLRKVAACFRIKMAKQHDALGDIKGTYAVFRRLMKHYEKSD